MEPTKINTKEAKTCYLIGGKSLLIQCAQVLQENQFGIQGVVSDSPEILDWAKSSNLKIWSVDKIESLIANGPVDYIFSITHLEIIPSTVLALARERAINFHDGPLPEYAGLNVTTWAIYNLENEHAVTWHEMTDKVDEGNILSEQLIVISENETAFTLNIKCYSAALDSFRDLIRKLKNGQLVSSPQKSGKLKLYKRCDRMPAMGVIDWNQPSKKIHALVRSLDFGPYANTINIPKLLVNDKIYYVQETEIVEASRIKPDNAIDANSLRPGTILVEGEHPVISTTDNYIKIIKAVDGNGNSVLPASDLAEGSILIGPSSDQIALLESWDQQAFKGESYWLKALRNVEQLNLPYLNAKSVKSENCYSSIEQSFDKQNLEKLSISSDAGMQSLLAIFLARICNVAAFSLFFNLEDNEDKNEFKNLFFQTRVPVNFSFNYRNNIAELIEYSHKEILNAASMHGYALELGLREPDFPVVEKPAVLLDFEGGNSPSSRADLEILVNYESGRITWHYQTELFSKAAMNQFISLFSTFIDNLTDIQDVSVAEVGLISKKELQLMDKWNGNNKQIDKAACMHHLFEQQVIDQPKAPAVSFAGEEIDYSTLNCRANKVAHYLLENRVQPDQLVGVLLDRSIDMLVAMIGILKSGAAYLPLDPDYPKDRIEYMLEDSQAVQVITESKYRSVIDQKVTSSLEIDLAVLDDYPDYNPNINTPPSSLAYAIYTSGSTGKPKGVMVEHRNVINFFSGMDDVIQATNGVWLAVTSISFDISVLELFWTLANGFKVVLFSDSLQKDSRKLKTRHPDKDMKFSMFYWNVADSEHDYDVQPYRLLLESAKYADRNDFEAVWMPERHFHAFGGLFPNPAITCSALATVTDNIQLRAGSCVVPLHHPARVAEEWAVVDNLSNGRVGISIASGWQPNDFLLMPQNHENAKNIMFENLEIIRKLWRGEAVTFDGPNGPVETRTLPRPKQKELPIWVTTAGNPETFRMAGEYGASILTHLLGQSVDGVAKNIEIYRQAYRDSGHEGGGYVTLLLHTLIGGDEKKVKALAREPMKKYLKSAMFLVKAAAWHFPTFKTLSEETGQTLDEYFENISDDDLDSLLEFAFERYYKESGLFGTPERALGMVDSLKEIGVNEIGCLIDYGMETDTVLDHLPALNELRKISIKQPKTVDSADSSIPALINRHEITHLQCTPSMANMLISDPHSSAFLGKLDHIMVGGEAFPSGLSKELCKLEGTRVTNMYGPTETTIWSTTLDVTKEMGTVPIGRPICNTEVYILDQCNQPFPHGIAGELCIGGSGVVRGYHNRVELTDERFIPDTFKKNTDSRIYRTGDMARYGEAGIIEYLGRSDHQVKIRGYRIELGEIEALLGQHSHVRDVVVILREDIPGDQRLVAYVVPKEEHVISSELLRSMLREHLPEHMIPAHIVSLAQLPLTPNGKVDRKALPLPGQDHSESIHEFQAPTTAAEKLIADLWCEILGLEQVSIHDQFFELGGHSLTATQLIARLRKIFYIEVPLQSIFETPTIAGLSRALISNEKQAGQIENIATALKQIRESEAEQATQDSHLVSELKKQGIDTTAVHLTISKYPATDRPPLSFGQQRQWFLDKLEPGSHYNDAFSLRLHGEIDIGVLEKSINAIIARHEVLRTVFATGEGEPYQVIAPELYLKLEHINLCDISDVQRVNKVEDLIADQIGMPIELASGPVLRTALYQLGDNEYVFLLVIHQIANDSWSIGVFMNELWQLYQAFNHNEPSPLAELNIQYSDYAQWQHRWFEKGGLDKELAYWEEKLSGELPVLDLATDYPRPTTQSFKGARHFFRLSDKLVEGLKKLSAESGCTPFITLLTVFKILLSRYTGQTDIIVGAPIANRIHQETTPLLGMFINNLVLRTNLSGDPTFRQLLMRVITTATEAYDNPNVPFERLVEALRPDRDLSRTPVFQVMFDYQNTPLELPQLPTLQMEPHGIDSKMSRFDLTFELAETDGEIKGHWEYNTDLYSSSRIERMAEHFLNLLSATLELPDQHISELPILSEAERNQIVVDWNITEVSYSADKGIHQLFEQQAKITPDKTALIMGDATLSYAQLNQQANRLARQLIDKGATGNTPVGIYLERSFEMVVAMLGILKAGAAYLPLDPSYPKERITYMLQDSQASSVVTQDALSSHLANFGVTTISLDQPLAGSGDDLQVSINTEDLAYILYTSGSTGRPKGVEISIRSVVNFLCSMQQTPGLKDTDVLLAITTISFDISVLELFLPLTVGAQVVIASQEESSDVKKLCELLDSSGATVMQSTPSRWRMLLESGWTGGSDFKVLCGGEPFPPDLARDLVSCCGEVWNGYGPTETTTYSTFARLDDPEGPITIGKPIANTQVYVLNDHQSLQPIGVPGELYIGGDGVAVGYTNLPELTAERFVPDKFTGGDGRLYRTGDLARWRSDGMLEHLGRIDSQVKVRGFRIELGEIESVLAELDTVKAVACNVWQAAADDKRLVAYIVPVDEQSLVPTELRKFLKELLPDYMVPAMYVDVQTLPLTPSGKVDRKALPNPFVQRADVESHVPPRSKAEKTIAAIWQDVLHIEQVGIHDNFFDLGGHSLLSMQVIARIEKVTGCIVGPRAMVMDTLEQIAATCRVDTEDESLAGHNLPQYAHSRSFIGKVLRMFTR